ncbi:hypothetical protein [Agromyces seonyuensis]|uniref:hypothetical protein n=1 Tax=Agromyces seonyuensis TaxID=2662446 RepID=UPI003AFB3C36
MSAERAGTAAGGPPARADVPLTGRRRRQAYWVAVAVTTLTILDLSKVNVALPSIETALGAGPTELQLVVAGYTLTFGLVAVGLVDAGARRRSSRLGGRTVPAGVRTDEGIPR